MSTVTNPLLPGCYPDPSICRVGDDYYLVTSTFEYLPGLPVLHSRDLVSWEQIGHVVDRPGQLDYTGVASSGGLYAPTIRHHDGVFWIICTLVDQRDASRGGNFLMTATDPAGPWSDPVWLDAGGIDPSIFFDDDGRVWVHGTRLAREPRWHDQTEVWVRELDPVSKSLVGPEHVIWHGAVEGVVWAEAPHLYKVDGTYYLLAAEAGTEFHHAESVARADSVTGPYVGYKGNPVLTHRHLGRGSDVVGTGHADLVQAADGSWWAVLLAMRTYGGYHYPLGRETFLVPVEWEQGWPVFAPGVGRVPTEVDVPFATDPRPGLVQGGTSGVVPSADPRWTAVRALPTEVATPAGDGWDLPLRAATLADVEVPAFLGLRLQHRDADLTARVRADLADGEEVGLAVRQSEKDHVRLAVGPDGDGLRARVVHRQRGEDRVLGETSLAAGAGATLTLSVRARGADLELLVGAGDGAPVVVGTAATTDLDTVATGGFLGLWLGVYGTSAGRPTQTVAHVDGVEYVPAV
ncbi:glycoside hydrolase family 43 protein [Cellulomonas shaoxiangyii]|uniref:Glycoside hydrolase family 43 protein n=1 Tax=Cellulomonas shaoxiangyii TaxID=2566013 RepID=A0A4P7SG16_9CELL|nr:glycoside hydrolase family 43 protein [Cellulomonas shaoxiangyii]QCB92531.1 glycoside hydrolase family 43 protein [Cellulomonas shaoxiangyii]TGY81509.1 glycoside hydrolase family 43 protein [Cellulomonas shaoxiangyii]